MKLSSLTKLLIPLSITVSSVLMPARLVHADTKSEVPLRTYPSSNKEINYAPVNNVVSFVPTKFKMGPSIKYWDKVAKCESNSNWQDGGNWSGGLGIAQSTWEGYGGLDFAPKPSKATKLQQIVVANRIAVFGYQTKDFRTLDDRLHNKPFYRDPVGFYGWGCIKNNRYLKPPKSNTYTAYLPKDQTSYCPQFEETFKKYGLPAKVFSYIAYRESRCNPGAVNALWENGKLVWTLNKNGSYDSGLLQINSSWFNTLADMGYQPGDLFKPEVNALFASWILHFSVSRLGNWNVKARMI